uniref:Uncharacterized protein n=1 Tax=Ciona savignyi TaxID=51511 RepID=H2Z004_CIOSA
MFEVDSLRAWLNSGIGNSVANRLREEEILLGADDDNLSDEYMDVLNEDDVSQQSDIQYLDASELPASGHRQDVFMREGGIDTSEPHNDQGEQ